MKKKILSIVLAAFVLTALIPLNAFQTINAETATQKKITEYSVGDCVYFGTYPQSAVTDESIVNALNELAGVKKDNVASSTSGWASYNYYRQLSNTQSNFMRYKDISYGANKYRGVVFDAYRTSYYYSNENILKWDELFQKTNGYLTGNVYWFKYEPVKWRVLDPNSGYIMSELILDAQAFNYITTENGSELYDKNGNYANNYANSEIRTWLINDFYNTTFSSSQKKLITKPTLDNSAYSAEYNKYNSSTTYDYVFLPSYSDLEKATYGFTSDASRRTQGTDYAKCQGLFVGRSTAEKNYSFWTLRTPADESRSSCSVSAIGELKTAYVIYANRGIRPAIKISTGSVITQQTAYTVNTYTMNTSGQYELTTSYYNDEINKQVSATYTVPTGFTLNTSKSTLSGNTGTTGSLVLNVYIDRKKYKLSTTVDGASDTKEYYYEQEVIKPENPQKPGYTFYRWTMNIPNKMPAYNIVAVAIWDENSNYTVEYDTAGGTNVANKTYVKWTDTVLSNITPPTRTGYELTGWKHKGTDVTDSTAYKDLVANDTVPSVKLTAQWKDIAAPTGEIKLGTNGWKTFFNDITFGLFFKDTQEVIITATDNSGENVTIEYLLSNKKLSETELENKTFTAYTDKFTVEPNNEYVIYAKLTDKSKNVAYINSNGIVLDNVKPVISGIEDGKTYCSVQTVTVSDNDGIASVTVNGNPVTPDTNGQFTLSPAESEQKIIVTDKAGNQAEMTVTVNDGHTYDWQSENGQYWQKCTICEHETEKKDVPEITINGADRNCKTQDYTFTATFFEGAVNPKYAYGNDFFGTGDQNYGVIDGVYTATVSSSITNEVSEFTVTAYAETSDGYTVTVRKIVAVQSEHIGGTATCTDKAKCEVCGMPYGDVNPDNHTDTKEWSTKNATQHEQTWKCCGATVVALENHEWKDGVCEECEYICLHTGGTATCTDKAVCTLCGEEYGEVDNSNHDLEHIKGNAATVTDTGNTEYWHCKDCDGNFSDKDGKNAIDLKDTVIGKLPPEIIDGKGQSLTAGDKKELTFRSNAAFGDFIRVELDGETVDEKNYTVKEGSTVVTLKADYVATLSAGEHTIGIVSESGTATTTFTVNAKAVDTVSPKTGDNSRIASWFVLALLSGGAFIGTTVYGRNKKRFVK